jgi:hypothetical protein
MDIDFEDFVDNEEKNSKQTSWLRGGSYGGSYSSQDDYEDEDE